MTYESFQKEYDLKFSSLENIKLGLKDPNTGIRIFAAKALSKHPLTPETLGLWDTLIDPQVEPDLAVRHQSSKYVTSRPIQTQNLIFKIFSVETDPFLYQAAILNLNIFMKDFFACLAGDDKIKVKEILAIRKNDFKDKKLLTLMKNLKKDVDKRTYKD